MYFYFDPYRPNDYFYFYRISYMYYTLIGFGITLLLSTCLSIWFPQKGGVSRKLLSPILYEGWGAGDEEVNLAPNETNGIPKVNLQLLLHSGKFPPVSLSNIFVIVAGRRVDGNETQGRSRA